VELGGARPRHAGYVDPRHLPREARGLDGGVQEVAGEGMRAEDLRDLTSDAADEQPAADNLVNDEGDGA